MTQYTEFIKQYADDNALSYKQAMIEAKEKDAYQQYKNKLSRTVDISLDTEVEPPHSPPHSPPKQKKKRKKTDSSKKATSKTKEKVPQKVVSIQFGSFLLDFS